jgi:uncharacterized membrane protein YqiK
LLSKISPFHQQETTRHPDNSDALTTIVEEYCSGIFRGVASKHTANEIFEDRNDFHENSFPAIRTSLNNLGIELIELNIKDIGDTNNQNSYFEEMKQRELKEKQKEAQIAIQEAETRQRQKIAILQQQAVEVENKQKELIAKSNADLAKKEAEMKAVEEKAKVESKAVIQKSYEEQQKLVEMKHAEKQLEHFKATLLQKAKVEKEKELIDAEAYMNSVKKRAEADKYAKQQEADALLYMAVKKADGEFQELKAKGDGLGKLFSGSGNNADLVQFYLGDKSGLFTNIAKQQSDGLQGLKPNITVWNTGNDPKALNPLGWLPGFLSHSMPALKMLEKSGINPIWKTKSEK